MKEKILLLFKWSLFVFLIMVIVLPSNATIGDNKIVPKIIDPVDLCPGRIAGTEPCFIIEPCIVTGEDCILIFPDTDCDGWSDDDEKFAGTDPNCCNDYPQIIGYKTFGGFGCGKDAEERIRNNIRYDVFIRKASSKYNIPHCLLKALLAWESGLKPYIVGSVDKHDKGIAQINDGGIAGDCGLSHGDRPTGCGECGNGCGNDWPPRNSVWNPQDAINCAAQALKDRYNAFSGTEAEKWKFAIAAYNAGQGGINDCKKTAEKWFIEDYKTKNNGTEPDQSIVDEWSNIWTNVATYGGCKSFAISEVTNVFPLYNNCIQEEVKK